MRRTEKKSVPSALMSSERTERSKTRTEKLPELGSMTALTTMTKEERDVTGKCVVHCPARRIETADARSMTERGTRVARSGFSCPVPKEHARSLFRRAFGAVFDNRHACIMLFARPDAWAWLKRGVAERFFPRLPVAVHDLVLLVSMPPVPVSATTKLAEAEVVRSRRRSPESC